MLSDSVDAISEATVGSQKPQKRRGRPKGSVNKDKASNGKVEEITYVPSVWTYAPPDVRVMLASEHAPDGLESVIKEKYIVGVSALPNGNASIITDIGMQQPFILVTAEPYESVRNKVFPGVSKTGV